MIEYPVVSRSEETDAEFDVLLPPDTDGAALPLSGASVRVILANISAPPAGQSARVFYRIDNGAWADLPPGGQVDLEMDCSMQTLFVKRFGTSIAGRVRVTIIDVPHGLYAEDTLLVPPGPGGPEGPQGPAGPAGAAGVSWSATVNAQTGTAYTLQVTDNGQVVTLNNASAITLTVPSGLGVGFSCAVIQIGAGQVTVAGSGVAVNSFGGKVKTSGQHATATLVAYAANVFNLCGNLV